MVERDYVRQGTWNQIGEWLDEIRESRWIEEELGQWDAVIRRWAFWFSRTIPGTTVDDLIQIARLGVLERVKKWHQERFEPSGNKVGWMNSVVKKILIDHGRYQSRRARVIPLGPLNLNDVGKSDTAEFFHDHLVVHDDSDAALSAQDLVGSLVMVMSPREAALLECLVSGGTLQDFVRKWPDAEWWTSSHPGSRAVQASRIRDSLREKAGAILRDYYGPTGMVSGNG